MPGVAETFAQWDEKIEVNRDWYPSRHNRNVEPADAGNA